MACLSIMASQASNMSEVGEGGRCHKEETQGSLWGYCIHFLGPP